MLNGRMVQRTNLGMNMCKYLLKILRFQSRYNGIQNRYKKVATIKSTHSVLNKIFFSKGMGSETHLVTMLICNAILLLINLVTYTGS